MTFDVD